jgi:hypothetical protein
MEQNRRHKKTRPAHSLKRKTNFLAVHRYRNLAYYKQLEPGQFRLLNALQNGATLD